MFDFLFGESPNENKGLTELMPSSLVTWRLPKTPKNHSETPTTEPSPNPQTEQNGPLCELPTQKRVPRSQKIDLKDLDNPSAIIKFITIGNVGAGKTSIIHRFTSSEFTFHHDPTLSVEYDSKVALLDPLDRSVKYSIWDTSGSERFNSLTRSYYRSAAGILLVYDVSRRISFENVENWISRIEDYCDPGQTVTAIVGNKVDLGGERREVDFSEGEELARSRGMLFFEVSAKTGDGVDSVFEGIAETVIRRCLDEEMGYNNEYSGVFLRDQVLERKARRSNEKQVGEEGTEGSKKGFLPGFGVPRADEAVKDLYEFFGQDKFRVLNLRDRRKSENLDGQSSCC